MHYMKNQWALSSFLQKYISPDELCVLACSTGSDSMFLLNTLLKSSYQQNIIVCYFDHKTRPETQKEVEFIQNFCASHSITCEIGGGNIPELQKESSSISMESLARQKRYEFLETMRVKHQAKYILTAHHLDDKIETFFFHLLRGTKLTGLINMQEQSGNILRPLLSLEKSEILQYMELQWWVYCIDSSNADTHMKRNFLRHEILPKCGEINPQYKNHLQNLMEYFWECKAYIDAEITEFLWEKPYLLLEDFHKKSPFFQKELLRYLYMQVHGNSAIWLSEANIEEMLKVIHGKNHYVYKDFHQLRIRKEHKKLYWERV